MSVNKIGSKLAHGVRQVKSQQIKPGQPEADKPEALPASAPASDVANKSDRVPVVKPSARRPAQQADQSGSEQALKADGNLHPRRVWPD